MNVNFELYKIFYTVANAKNITRAALELSISQPAISKSIKNLEEQLGGQLFIRTKRGVILTSEGQEFYTYIKNAVEYINNAEHKFTDLINLETGVVKIGVSTTLTKEFLLPYLEAFHKKYPKIEIQILTNLTAELFPKLRDGLIDLIIYNMPYNIPEDMDSIICRKVQDCFVVNKDYPELINRKVKLEELNNYPLVLQLKGSNTRNFIDGFCLKNNVSLKSNMSLASYSLVVEFAKIGFGIGYATKNYIKNDLQSKKLFELDIEPKIPTRGIGLSYSKKNLPSFSTKKLMAIIMQDINK